MPKNGNNTNPKKLLHVSPHPRLLPLEKVTMRTYWDWYNIPAATGMLMVLQKNAPNRFCLRFLTVALDMAMASGSFSNNPCKITTSALSIATSVPFPVPIAMPTSACASSPGYFAHCQFSSQPSCLCAAIHKAIKSIAKVFPRKY